MSKFIRSKWAVFCLLAIIIIAVFGQTIWFDYVQLDEGILLINNRFFISDISNFFEVFEHDINYPSAVAPYYRPMFVLSFLLNSQMGVSPLAYHIGNVAFHIAAAFMVFWLLNELGAKKVMSVFFSALFAIHPAVTPVVSWVPGRIEAILTIFTILSFIIFVRFLKTNDWRYLVGFLLSFLAALFTKEVVLAMIPVLVFYSFMHRKEKGSDMLVTLSSGLVAIILGWYFVRKSVLAQIQVNDISFSEMMTSLWSNLSAVVLYLGKVILPFNLTVLPTPGSSTLVLGFIALIILAAYSFLSKTKLSSNGVLGLVWFVVLLLPSLATYNSPEKIVFFEHRLYLPLIGIIIFFATSDWVNKINFGKAKNKIPLFAIFILFAALAFNYSGAYKNKMSFWQKAVADSPNSPEAHNGLATVYLLDGKISEAEAEFIKTVELNPNEKGVHLLLGLYYLDQNLFDKAKIELEKELKIDPNQFVAYHSLGRIYAQNKKLKEAESYFIKALEINPNYILVRQDLVVLYFTQNKHSQATVQLKELLKIQKVENLHPQILEILKIYAEETAKQKGF